MAQIFVDPETESDNEQFYEHDDYFKTNRSLVAEEPAKNDTTINELTRSSFVKQNNQPLMSNRVQSDAISTKPSPINESASKVLASNKENRSTVNGSSYTKLSRSLLIVFSILFIFGFFLMLIQHWKCTLRTNSIIKSSPNNCNYRKTMSKLGDDLFASFQLIIDWLFNMKQTTHSWPLRHPYSGQLLDPIFSWFFNQYREGN